MHAAFRSHQRPSGRCRPLFATHDSAPKPSTMARRQSTHSPVGAQLASEARKRRLPLVSCRHDESEQLPEPLGEFPWTRLDRHRQDQERAWIAGAAPKGTRTIEAGYGADPGGP